MSATHGNRLARLEAAATPVGRTISIFVPIGIADTPAADGWIAKERLRKGAGPRDRVVTLCWQEIAD